MNSSQPDDPRIRQAVRNHIHNIYASAHNFVVIEELGLQRGAVRADIAVVNGVLHGYEIKSDRDSLRRLGRQAELYSAVFDVVTLVTSENHLPRAAMTVPPWWEILIAVQDGDVVSLHTVREGGTNPATDMRALAELIWLERGIELLKMHGYDRGTSKLRRSEVWDLLCSIVPNQSLRDEVKRFLMARAVNTTVQPRW